MRPAKCVVVLPTSRLAESLRFYCEALRLELVEEWSEPGTGAIVGLRDGVELELIELEGVAEPPEPRQGIGLQVEPDEVDAAYERLQALGFRTKRPPEVRAWGMRGFGAIDPNGVPVNVYAPAD